MKWALHVLTLWRPRLKYVPPGDAGEFEVDLFGAKTARQMGDDR